MADKINRPPLQCTVIRNEESTRFSEVLNSPGEKGTVVFAPGGSIPTPIKAHIDKVSKMRIFEEGEPMRLRQ